MRPQNQSIPFCSCSCIKNWQNPESIGPAYNQSAPASLVWHSPSHDYLDLSRSDEPQERDDDKMKNTFFSFHKELVLEQPLQHLSEVPQPLQHLNAELEFYCHFLYKEKTASADDPSDLPVPLDVFVHSFPLWA